VDGQANLAEVKPLELKEWLRAINRSRSFFYALTPQSLPRMVRTGRRIVVLETPQAWFERMAAAGGAVTQPKQRAAA